MKLSKKSIPPVRMEMTPLMDCVFLLLVFFVYAMLSMAVHHGKQVDLPQSGSAALETQEAISITIENAKDGLKISVDDGLPCNLAELEQVLREKKTQGKNKEPDLQIFADKTVPYQSLYTVLDCITRAGLSKISLQAKAE